MLKPIVITSGEPAGIGPDLIPALMSQSWPVPLVILGDPKVLNARAQQIGSSLSLLPYSISTPLVPGQSYILPLNVKEAVVPGHLNRSNVFYVLSLLDRAIEGCLSGEFSALVTLPIHKAIIQKSGLAFTGHTEYLALKTDTPRVVMMLISPTLRVALATTHLALRAVPDAITTPLLIEILEILHTSLKNTFKISHPRIGVLGLNPHAGEEGCLGNEEIMVIEPALRYCRKQGMDLVGPLAADTAFISHPASPAYDVVLAMYHDQGLPVLKYSNFKESINMTLGLPFVRVSVDHGTALDLAGTGTAYPDSLLAAVNTAIKCLKQG